MLLVSLLACSTSGQQALELDVHHSRRAIGWHGPDRRAHHGIHDDRTQHPAADHRRSDHHVGRHLR